MIPFSEHLIKDGFGYSYGLATADLDGDGRLDITAADADRRALYWFRNEGNGCFSHRHIQREHPKPRLERHAIGDINANGRPDVIIVENLTGDIYWFENPGSHDKVALWTRHDITIGGMPYAYDVALADISGNGRPDVAATGWEANQVAWFEHPGSDGGTWIKHLIDDAIAEARTVRIADFNRNGNPDLLVTGTNDDLIVWYEHPGRDLNAPWRRHVIDDSTHRPSHGHPLDMVGDGGMAVVMAAGMAGDETRGSVAWYEPRENVESPWIRHSICDDLPHAFEAVAADLDGDGAVEVVATSWARDGGVYLFKHHGDPRGPWRKQTIKEEWSRANQITIADLDGDGRPDILAQAERGANELRWWRNEGNRL